MHLRHRYPDKDQHIFVLYRPCSVDILSLQRIQVYILVGFQRNPVGTNIQLVRLFLYIDC